MRDGEGETTKNKRRQKKIATRFTLRGRERDLNDSPSDFTELPNDQVKKKKVGCAENRFPSNERKNEREKLMKKATPGANTRNDRGDKQQGWLFERRTETGEKRGRKRRRKKAVAKQTDDIREEKRGRGEKRNKKSCFVLDCILRMCFLFPFEGK